MRSRGGSSAGRWQQHVRSELVLAALERAYAQRRPRQVIHHSDHGAQYTSIAFGRRCRELGVRPSMGGVGDCFDNATAESFFATPKRVLDRQHFRTHDEARRASSAGSKAGTTPIGATPRWAISRR